MTRKTPKNMKHDHIGRKVQSDAPIIHSQFPFHSNTDEFDDPESGMENHNETLNDRKKLMSDDPFTMKDAKVSSHHSKVTKQMSNNFTELTGTSKKHIMFEDAVVGPVDVDTHKLRLTVDEAIDRLGFGFFQILMLFVCGVSWTTYAMQIMLLSFLLPVVGQKWNLSATSKATLGSIFFLGMAFGAYSWGYVSDRFGRKKGIIINLIFCTVFGVFSAFSPNFVSLLILRSLVGFGAGGMIIPFALLSEYIPTKQRGHCLIIIEFFWTFGAICVAGLGWIVLPENTEWRIRSFHLNGWRWLLIISSIPSLVALILIFFTPDSPRYYRLCKKMKTLNKLFKWIAKFNCKPYDFVIVFTKDKSEQNIDTSCEKDHSQSEDISVLNHVHCDTIKVSNDSSHFDDNSIAHKEPCDIAVVAKGAEIIGENQTKEETRKPQLGRFIDLFSKKLITTTLPVFFIWFIGGLCYYGVIVMTPEYFRIKGKGDIYLETFVTSLAEAPGLVFAILTINSIGRKKTQAISFLICGICIGLLLVPMPMWMLTVSAIGARAMIMSATCTTYVYTPEVFPTSVRAVGLGACSSVSRIAGIITPYIASLLIKVSYYIPVSIYGGSTLLAALLSALLPKETNGSSLVDTIEECSSEKENEK